MNPGTLRGVLSITLALFGVLGGLMPASAEDPASIRLVAASSEIVAFKYAKRAWVDPGTYVAAVGGAFDLRVTRPSYDQPVDLVQIDPETDQVIRDLPEDVLDGWFGLDDFLSIRIRNKEGEQVFFRKKTFCPNDGQHERVNDLGPQVPQYPLWCTAHPFMKGMVWGIDEGWAAGTLGWDRFIPVKVPVGKYILTVSIKEPYRELFAIAAADASRVMELTVKKGDPPGEGGFFPRLGTGEGGEPLSGVPEDTSPDPATLPDLVALPAWSMTVYRQGERELLGFAAMEWNAGPQPLVVEGFRQPDQDVMDAFQYFYENGEPVGRAPAGTMKFHTKKGHQHWHFRQFTEYTLLDKDKAQVVTSTKRSWCLAPTDAVDLTVPGADWQPGHVGLTTACGSPSALWVRETLPVGWGDTYFQFVAGQAFDITGLQGGTYYVKVQVNPLGGLYETDLTNNVMLRKIKLRGGPAHRTVVVPPWKGIDTEEYGYGGFGFGSAGD
jgi:hypothetical protein